MLMMFCNSLTYIFGVGIAKKWEFSWSTSLNLIFSALSFLAIPVLLELEINETLFFMVIMIANGVFQAFLWMAILPIMKNWFIGKNGLIMSLWMINLNVGSLIAVWLCHYIIIEKNLKWEIVFYIISGISYFIGLISLLTLKTSPNNDET